MNRPELEEEIGEGDKEYAGGMRREKRQDMTGQEGGNESRELKD